MAKIIHMMIRVLDERRSLEFYEKAFGMSVVSRLDFEKFTLVYLSNDESSFEIELTINKGRTEAYNLGDGYGHFAVCVDDLEATHKRFIEEGLNPRKVVEFQPDGEIVAKFFFVTDPDGYEIEVLQRQGHYQ